MKRGAVLLVMGLMVYSLNAQQNDSLRSNKFIASMKPEISVRGALKRISDSRQRIKSLIVPAGLITYGVVSGGNDLVIF